MQILPTIPDALTPKAGEDSDNFAFHVEAAADTWSQQRGGGRNRISHLTGMEIESARAQLAVLIRALTKPVFSGVYLAPGPRQIFV